MKKSVKIIIAVIILIALFVAGAFALKHYSKKYQVVENNKGTTAASGQETLEKVKDMTFFDGDLKECSVSSFKGKSVVVNFWAEWCPPCKAELPHFQKAYEQYKDKVEFMMVNIEKKPEAIERFAKESGYTFPIYHDMNNASDIYNVTSFPFTIFINPEGYVVSTRLGQLDEATLFENIEQTLR